MAQAKDAKEVTAMHADYVASQIAALSEKAEELSKQAAKIAGKDPQH